MDWDWINSLPVIALGVLVYGALLANAWRNRK